MSGPTALEQVEDAIIERIRRIAGKHLRTVASLPAEMDEESFRKALRDLPGAYVYTALGGAARIGGLSMVMDAQWMVYFATAHVSGDLARRRGDSLQVGVYELIEVLGPALHGLTVPGVCTLSFVRAENLLAGSEGKQGVALYALTFQGPLAFDPGEPDLRLAPFEQFDADYTPTAHATDLVRLAQT